MTIKKIDGFYVDTSLSGKISVGVESIRLNQCLDYARSISASGLYGHPFHGFFEKDLDFLSDYSGFECISFIPDKKFESIDGVYFLKNLKDFSIFEKRPGIDFSKLSGLEKLNITYCKHDKGIGNLFRLVELIFWHYNPKSKSFKDTEFPENLELLQINWANPSDLDGIPVLKNLRDLEFSRCRNLNSLAGLDIIAPNLERLYIDGSGKLDIENFNVKAFNKLNFRTANKKRII